MKIDLRPHNPYFLLFLSLLPRVPFFLIDSPPSQSEQLARALEADLGSFGFDVASTTDRLAEFLSVENTYMSTFQMLGGLGLLLGTLGLGAVMLRNVIQRRGELALLRQLVDHHGTLRLLRPVEPEERDPLVEGVVVGSHGFWEVLPRQLVDPQALGKHAQPLEQPLHPPARLGEYDGMCSIPSCRSTRPTCVGRSLATLPPAFGVWK